MGAMSVAFLVSCGTDGYVEGHEGGSRLQDSLLSDPSDLRSGHEELCHRED